MDNKNITIIMIAEEIVKYIDEKYAIDVDIFDIEEIINLTIRDSFDRVKDDVSYEDI